MKSGWLFLGATLGGLAFGLPSDRAHAVEGDARPASNRLGPSPDAWSFSGRAGIRGVTLGPIENLRHEGRGYGTEASERGLIEAKRMGASWVSLTPFGRASSLEPEGIDMSFEAPFEENRRAVRRAIDQAHAQGLSVFLVPHLWVESGEWRALIDPKTDDGWKRWAESYRRFVLAWADVAREGNVEMFSVGVELRSWVTTSRASTFIGIIREIRGRYPGLLTYSANWDDADQTLVWDELDLVGINAFYPLASREGAPRAELTESATRIVSDLGRMSQGLGKPIVFTEFGYTTRKDPALKPWEWPDGMNDVIIDEQAQADAYAALLQPVLDAPFCAGYFVWRLYADPSDVSQEAEWGFSPRGKLAEVVLRDAFSAWMASDGPRLPGDATLRTRARRPQLFGLTPEPPLFEE